MSCVDERQSRTALLIGESGIDRLADCHVVVAGLGGVGGHCTEALARAGIGRLHLIDNDTVQESNLNRQLIATKSTIGMKKNEAMKQRLFDVSDCEVTVSDLFILPDTVAAAVPQDADFIVDAIDTLAGKVALAKFAKEHGIPIISCMGAGNRLDPAGFSVTDLYKTDGCPLARRFRQALRKEGIDRLPVVFSKEPAKTQPNQTVIGSIAPVPAAAGLVAAGYVIRTLIQTDLDS